MLAFAVVVFALAAVVCVVVLRMTAPPAGDSGRHAAVMPLWKRGVLAGLPFLVAAAVVVPWVVGTPDPESTGGPTPWSTSTGSSGLTTGTESPSATSTSPSPTGSTTSASPTATGGPAPTSAPTTAPTTAAPEPTPTQRPRGATTPPTRPTPKKTK